MSVSAFSGGTCLFAAAEGEETKGREQVIVSDYVGPVCSPGVLLFDGQFGPSHLPTADHVPTLRWPRPGIQHHAATGTSRSAMNRRTSRDTMPAVTRPPHPTTAFSSTL